MTQPSNIRFVMEDRFLQQVSDINTDITNIANDVTDFGNSIQTSVETADGVSTPAYRLVQRLHYTSSGDFVKALYPWARAIHVKVQAAGGGSGGCALTAASQHCGGGGGGGGGYAEKFITDMSTLLETELVTVGTGGAGGAAGANAGSTGGTSSFGSILSATGGAGGSGGAAGTTSATASAGAGGNVFVGADFAMPGSSGTPASCANGRVFSSPGGSSYLSNGSYSTVTATSGIAPPTSTLYGSGAGGPSNAQSQAAARAGAEGADGIVIIDVYA